MSLSLIVAALGAVAALVGTGVLTARSVRMPSLLNLTLTIAVCTVGVGLGAQVLGGLIGYDQLTFRVMEIGAQALGPLALCVALSELVGRSVPARFTVRLAASAAGVVALVILGTDPLNPNATFRKTWPNPATFYQLPPKFVIEGVLVPMTVLTAIIALITLAARSGRPDGDRGATAPTVAAAVAALALAVPGIALLLQSTASKSLPVKPMYIAACLAAVVLTWFAGMAAGRLDLGTARTGTARAGTGRTGTARTGTARAGTRRAGPPGQGDWDSPAADGGRWLERDEYGAPPVPAVTPAADPAERYGRDLEEPYPALAALAAEGGGRRELGRPGYDDHGRRDDRYPADDAYWDETGISRPAWRENYPAGPEDPRANLFGQISIYTLIEDRVDEFDRLTERVVAKVRSREPDTLVYIVHAVPAAPMQRIMYEVYRDRAAYKDHQQRPYLARYENERRPCVLTVNIIELGLQQAKVSAFPSIFDILEESGIDLTGVTKSRGPDRAGPADQPYSPSGGRPPAAARLEQLPPMPMPPDPLPPMPMPPDLLPPEPVWSASRPRALPPEPLHRDPFAPMSLPPEPVHREPQPREPLHREPQHREPLHRDPFAPMSLPPEPVHREPLPREPLPREPLHRQPLHREPLPRDPFAPMSLPPEPLPRGSVHPEPLHPEPLPPEPLPPSPPQHRSGRSAAGQPPPGPFIDPDYERPYTDGWADLDNKDPWEQ